MRAWSQRRLTSSLALWLLGISMPEDARGTPNAPTPSAPAASPAPDHAAVAGLLTDIERIVDAQEAGGWFVDETSLRNMYPELLESVCRTPLSARDAALSLLQARSQRLGDPRALYEQAGEMNAAVEKALFAKRQTLALSFAMEGAARDCPFWVEPIPGYPGRQTDRDRFTLSLETGGMVQLRQTEATWALGGGGYGRLLAGYGFGAKFSLLAGPEFGGGAMLRPNTEPTEFVINYFPAIPVLFRWHDRAWHYDLEAAPVALFQADNGRISYGVRGGLAVGVFALKTRGILPWGGLAVVYEQYLPSGGRPRAHFLRGGLRVGLVWDP